MKEETLQKKQVIIDEIAAKIQGAKSLAIAEYKGISVADVTELRNKFREGGIDYKIYKNTMVARALDQLGIQGFDEVLNGPNAFIFSNEDMVLGPKIAGDFAKEHEDQFQIKAGLIDGKMINKEEVIALSKLPSKEVLVSMVLGALQAPISGLASVCSAEIASLLYALKAIEEKQGGGEDTAA